MGTPGLIMCGTTEPDSVTRDGHTCHSCNCSHARHGFCYVGYPNYPNGAPSCAAFSWSEGVTKLRLRREKAMRGKAPL